MAALCASIQLPFAHGVGVASRLVEDERAESGAGVGFVVPLAVGVGLASTAVTGVLVGALALALGRGPFALDVGGTGGLVADAGAEHFATRVGDGPHALSIVLASVLVVVAVEASEQAEITSVGVEFAAGVVDAKSLSGISSALHEAAVVLQVPDAHGIGGAESLVTFIDALAAASGLGRVPHAAVVTGAGSLVGGDELALDTAAERADGPRAHLLADAAVGGLESTAGGAAFVGDLVPHAERIGVTGGEEASIGVSGFASWAAAKSNVAFGGVPSAHGVGLAVGLLVVDGVGVAAVGTLARRGAPLAGGIGVAGFGLLVLVDATGEATVIGLVEAAHGGGQAGRLVEERAEAGAGGGVGVPLAIELRVARKLGGGAVAALRVASTVDGGNG